MRRFAVPLCVFVLAGCTVGPDYRPPEAGGLSVPDTYYQRPADAAAPADLARWWERFDDPLLTRLIDDATAAEVATNYVDARLAQDRLAIARDTLAIADDNLQIATWRRQAGLASSLDVEQARAARAQTAAVIPNLENAFSSATYRIAVL